MMFSSSASVRVKLTRLIIKVGQECFFIKSITECLTTGSLSSKSIAFVT